MDSTVPQQSVSGTNPPPDEDSLLESAFSKVRTVSDILVRCKTIPARHHRKLKERLSCVCEDPDKLCATHTRYRRTQTSVAYTTVLEMNPKAFLPFILAISPRMCRDFDVAHYCKSYPETRSIFLDDVDNLLDSIVNGLNIHDAPKYKKIKEHLRPKHSCMYLRMFYILVLTLD
jgi:hypothetical protein